jgi:hypothetical protein
MRHTSLDFDRSHSPEPELSTNSSLSQKPNKKKRRNQPRNKHQRHNTQFSQDKKSSHRYPSEESHLKLALHQKQRRKFLCRVPVAEDAGSERQQQTDRGVSLASFAHVVNVAVVIFKCE